MEQQIKKRSFSLGTKLLLIVVFLIMIVTAFLNVSAMLILREDKETQTYQSKSTEAMLAGNQFATMIGHALDTLRLTMATADPRAATLNPNAPKGPLQSVLDNQSDAALVLTFLLNPSTNELTPVASAAATGDRAGKLSLTPADFISSTDWIKAARNDLDARSYTLMNFSIGTEPILGAAVSNTHALDPEGHAGLALAILPLSRMAQEFSGMNLTIATKSGHILFDNDPARLFSHASVGDDPFFQFAIASNVQNGTRDFMDHGGRYLGSYVLPGYDLVALTRADWSHVMKATYSISEKFILLGLMALGAGIVFAILFSKTLTAPLQRLSNATSEVAAGHFKLALAPAGNDEIGSLTESFNTMSARIDELFKESIEKIQLENELNIASAVQQNLIPPAHFKQPELEVHSHYQSASHCGGDWWGLFRTRDRIVVGIADATGHGLQCALITAAARSAFSVLHKMAEEDPAFDFSPARMMSYINRSILDSASGKIMMTFFIGVIDLKSRTLTYANAGHNSPWLFRKEGESWVLNSLVGAGERLGESEAARTEVRSVAISVDDVLFMYTDGLTEGSNLEGKMYGKKRVRQVLESALSSGSASALERLLADFSTHQGGAPLADDVTITLARITDFVPA